MNDELLDISGGDPRRAKALQEQLTLLAEGDDPALREMATAVLAGNLRLREAAASEFYGEAITAGFTTFWTKYEELTPEDRDALAASGWAHIANTD